MHMELGPNPVHTGSGPGPTCHIVVKALWRIRPTAPATGPRALGQPSLKSLMLWISLDGVSLPPACRRDSRYRAMLSGSRDLEITLDSL